MRVAWLLVAALLLAACGRETATRAQTVEPRRIPVFTPAVVSSNWSGYVARVARGGRFDGASARWQVPRLSCGADRGTSAAFWVGIGGWTTKSPSLQQLGASADCSPAGVATYRLWTEIVPAAPTFLSMKVAAGDRVAARVGVAGGTVSFTVRNLTRGTRYSTTVRPRRTLDLSTAEWIAEAPSLCRTFSVCEVVPLSNFGTVAFSDVLASGGGIEGPLGTPTWRVTPVALVTSGGSSRYIAASNPSGAVPGPTSAGGDSFTVAFRQSLGGAVPAHPLPGAPLPAWVR